MLLWQSPDLHATLIAFSPHTRCLNSRLNARQTGMCADLVVISVRSSPAAKPTPASSSWHKATPACRGY